jgi:Transglutaminase-like superfamily
MPNATSELRSDRLDGWPANIALPTRTMALLEAFGELLLLDFVGLFGFRSLYSAVGSKRVTRSRDSADSLTIVRMAMRDACILYFRPVRCLAGSSAVVRMLRRRGIAGQLVIGYQPIPLVCHAWVELEGKVVWDARPQMASFHVLDRV